MWHVIILLPIVGIIVFWLLPLNVAIPVYLVILLLSGLSYWAIARAIRKRAKTGSEGLVGAMARVVSKLDPKDNAQYMVAVEGELWHANSTDILEPGETVRILVVEGLTLTVQRIGTQPNKPIGSGNTMTE